MLIFLVPIVIGFLAMALSSVGNTLKTGRLGTKFSRWCFKHGAGLGASAFFSLAILVIMLVGLFISHMEYAAFPSECKAITITLSESRGVSSSSIERAALMHKVIDVNREIAVAKYWDDSLWVGWFIPDRVANLELIK